MLFRVIILTDVFVALVYYDPLDTQYKILFGLNAFRYFSISSSSSSSGTCSTVTESYDIVVKQLQYIEYAPMIYG